MRGIAQLARPGHRYGKAGFMPLALEPAGLHGAAQGELMLDAPDPPSSDPPRDWPQDPRQPVASLNFLKRRFSSGTLTAVFGVYGVASVTYPPRAVPR